MKLTCLTARGLLCIILSLSIFCNIAFSQPAKKIRKVVPVLTQQTFYLNGGMRAAFGGKSRVYYQVDLPKNTVEWYYTFTTQDGKNPPQATLNLIPQLTKLVDPTGVTAIITSAIMCPIGSNACDIVFLDDRANANAFESKAEQNGGTYYYIKNSSRENFRNGTIQVKDVITGTHFLGFKNPSANTGITVTFEVAAIVEEADPDYEKAVNYGTLGWKAYESGDLDKCILYSKKALTLDNSLIFVKANLGLCYLQKDDELTAMDYYMEALSGIKKLTDIRERKAYLLAVIKDIDDALIRSIKMPGNNTVLEMYRAELNTTR